MAVREVSRQEEAEGVLAQIEAALRIAGAVDASDDGVAELPAIHRRLHQRGVSHCLQGSIF